MNLGHIVISMIVLFIYLNRKGERVWHVEIRLKKAKHIFGGLKMICDAGYDDTAHVKRIAELETRGCYITIVEL
jgi:hypothetical protein